MQVFESSDNIFSHSYFAEKLKGKSVSLRLSLTAHIAHPLLICTCHQQLLFFLKELKFMFPVFTFFKA